MMWSKVRARIRELILPELRGRIDVHCTRYHASPEEEGEAWITIDGEKVAGRARPRGPGIQDGFHITASLRSYLNVSIDEAVTATNPVIRAFSLVDRRLGRRRFEQVLLAPDEHPLVVRFHALRCEVLKVSANDRQRSDCGRTKNRQFT